MACAIGLDDTFYFMISAEPTKNLQFPLVPILKLVREIPTSRVLLTFSSTHRPNTSINTPSIHTNRCSTIKWCTLFGMECDNSVICTFTEHWEARKSYSCFEMTTRLTYGNVHFTHIIPTRELVASIVSPPPQFLIVDRIWSWSSLPPPHQDLDMVTESSIHLCAQCPCQWPSYLLLLKSQSPQVYTLSRHS